MKLFLKKADFDVFERIIQQTLGSSPMRLLAYFLMSNHWHFLLWPERDGDLGAFMQKLPITHARNWQVHRRRVGSGHLYQGRYKSFPIEGDEPFYQVVRYMERNPFRARLARRAEDWRYGAFDAEPTAHPKRVKYWATGRLLGRVRGCGTSTSRRRKWSHQRSAAVSSAASPTAARAGRVRPRVSLAWNRHSIRVAVRRSKATSDHNPKTIGPVPCNCDLLTFAQHR